MSPWISSADAAARLGVSRATLYAYVSRGQVRSQAQPGDPRQRQYASDDVERLRLRADDRRHPDKAAARALTWGMPVLDSGMTLIDGQSLYYRGHDALTLARTRSLADVASLIWTGRWDAPVPAFDDLLPRVQGDPKLPFAHRAQASLSAAAAHDEAAFDLRAASVAACGWRILRRLTDAATGDGARPDQPETIDRRLARVWRIGPRGADVLRTALILCADHELNVSSFTARCVASTGADPYAVVIAGLSALVGPKHGGAASRVDAMLTTLRRETAVRAAVAARFHRGERVEGFGHPLYAGGDPRAAALMTLLRERYPDAAERRFVVNVQRAVTSLIHEEPNIDFALAALVRVLRLPPDGGLIVFALGRTIGWIGHAIEQYAADQLIRPRARYVGPAPTSSEETRKKGDPPVLGARIS